jgi:hypothetical protein
MESINEAARYATGSNMVRDRYTISAAQMRIHKLLAEAAVPTVDTLSSREEHPTPSFKGTVSSTSKRTFLGNVLPKSKPLINLSAFTPKSFTENDTSNTRRAAVNKCNVTIAEVIKKEKPEYVLPDYISYPSSEDECGNVTGTKVPKRKKKSSKVMYVTPKALVLLVNNSNENKVPEIMYVMPKEQALPANDSDSDRGLFSSENVTDNSSRSSE